MVMITFPLMIGLAIVARPLVLVLLTEKWADCILYLQLLSLAGMLYPLHLINVTILPALGRSDLYFQLEIIKNILTIINIAVCWRWGITALVYGMVVNSVISYYLNSYYTRKLVGYAVREQLRDVFAYLIMALLMGIVVYMVSLLPFPNNLSLLLVQICTGTVIYIGLCRLFRLAAFMELWQVGWNKMQLLKSGNT